MNTFTFVALLLLTVAASSKETKEWSNLKSLAPKLPHYLFVRGKQSSGSRITGGQEAIQHQFPHQAGIIIETSSGAAFCGGSLISDEWILTAAHCAVEGSSFEVILGAHYVLQEEDTQVRITTTEKHVHPDWESTTLQNDIALLKLPTKVEEVKGIIEHIRLPSRSQANDNFVDEDTVVSGWGKDSDSASSISPVLRYVHSPVIRNSVCNIYYFGSINDRHICTSGSGGKSTCSGDSGGPLIIIDTEELPTQIGLVSFGIVLGCEIGWPPAFTRLTPFLSWIESTTGIPIRE